MALVQAELEAHEVTNSLILGLVGRLADAPLAYGSPPYFASVMDEKKLALAALMTPPHNLILAAGSPFGAGAVELLARGLLARHWPVPGVLAPVEVAEAFAAAWVRFTGVESHRGTSERVFELREVIPPRYSPGRLRMATEEDAELVLKWMEAFHDEALPSAPSTPSGLMRKRIAGRNIFLWEDGRPVSMAMKSRSTQHGVSIGGVYTPPEWRGQGYASSCVAALSQRLRRGL